MFKGRKIFYFLEGGSKTIWFYYFIRIVSGDGFYLGNIGIGGCYLGFF